MATLKGAYQRFVSSIFRIWKREEAEKTETFHSSEDLLSDDEEPQEEKNNNTDTFYLAREEPEPSHSAPDLLESGNRTPVQTPTPVKARPSNPKRQFSFLKLNHNHSDSNLQKLNSIDRHKNFSTPIIRRKPSASNFFRPLSVAVERPTYLRLQPPTPESSREPSPVLPRREPQNHNFLTDHHPVVLRRQLGQFSPKLQPHPTANLRREKSSTNLLRYSPATRPKRKARPKSVSDILTPQYPSEKPKLKKSTSFLKLSPSVFRKQSPTSPSLPELKERPQQHAEKRSESPRLRTFTLASKFSKFAGRIDGTLRKRTKSDAKSLKITVMKKIEVSADKSTPVEPFLGRLRDYNTYYEGREALQFKWKQDKDGNLVIDGMLNIYWGLKKSIRLQMQDSGVKIRPQSQLAFAQAEAVRRFEERTTGEPIGEENVDIVMKNETISGTLLRRKLSKAVESTKNGEEDVPMISIENGILGDTRHRNYDRRRMALRLKNGGEKVHVQTEGQDGLMRQKSVILRKRLANKSARKRFSINGHAYNHQTSVFTPAYASVTNVRVTSKTSCDDVIKHLLNKFRVENSFEEFSLYLIKESGERRELGRNEYPLITRVLSGPNEQVCKIFVMDRHVHQDISSEVAQYIKLDLNILQMFVTKFTEEEERETKKMEERYGMYRKMLQQRIQDLSET